MLNAIWPQFRSYPNALPADAGITSAAMIAYFVFWTRKFFFFFFLAALVALCHTHNTHPGMCS